MAAIKWIVVVLVLLNAGYMVVDGARALITGSYITPSSGEYAGQLGPWTKLVAAVGIQPSSALMKWIFIVYGMAWLTLLIFFLKGEPWAPAAMLAAAIGSLWYLWMGTVNSLLQVVLLLVLMLRR
jgi:hypothetical protein